MRPLSMSLVLLAIILLHFDKCWAICLQSPSYVSEWATIMSHNGDASEVMFLHDLGEVPLKVIVEINITYDNTEYIFHAYGSAHTDDDKKEKYGGLVYFYNSEEVLVLAPNEYNGRDYGQAMYTGDASSWTGPFYEEYSSVKVRAKAWRRDDLPTPNFESDWIDLDVTNDSLAYQEIAHDLNDYPDMVVIQVTGLGDYISEAQGMSTKLFKHPAQSVGGVVYGYSRTAVRIWTPYQNLYNENNNKTRAGTIVANDGWGNGRLFIATTGSCKIYAWKLSDPLAVYTFSANNINTDIPFSFNKTISMADSLVIAEVQPEEGKNSQFRFRGLGSVMNGAIGEPYGGLIYGYNSEEFVLWIPVRNESDQGGFILNIGGIWGVGEHNQSTNNVTIRLTVWTIYSEDQARCPYVQDSDGNHYRFSIYALFKQTATFSCLPGYKYVTGSHDRTCQKYCLWSGSELICRANTTSSGSAESEGTERERTERDENISGLRRPYKSTNRYQRSLTSAPDKRPSSTLLGAVFVSFLVFPVAFLALSDLRTTGCI